MSHEPDKVKNSKRRHNDESVAKKQLKIAKQHGIGTDNKLLQEPHRLVKHHAMDCGSPGCVMCGNPRRNKLFKYSQRLTAQERRMFQDIDNVPSKHSNGLPKNID